jgi:hypothetical protein
MKRFGNNKATPTFGERVWEFDAPQNFVEFLRALPALFDEQSVLYLEGTGTPRAVRVYLDSRRLTDMPRIRGGTLLPTPECFHLPITVDNMDGFSELLESVPDMGPPTHVHVYREGTVLLQWFDASAGEPAFLLAGFPRDELVQGFCAKVGSACRRVSDDSDNEE